MREAQVAQMVDVVQESALTGCEPHRTRWQDRISHGVCGASSGLGACQPRPARFDVDTTERPLRDASVLVFKLPAPSPFEIRYQSVRSYR